MFTHALPPTYTAMFEQCTWGRLVSIEWQLNWFHVSQAIILEKLEQLERLRSEDTPRRLMITHTMESCWTPVKTRSNDLEDVGQGQRSLHATHPLLLMIICAKYGKNASRIGYFFQGEIRKISEKLKF